MNFHEWAKSQEAAGLAEVHTLTELQYAEIGEGPWALYIYGSKWDAQREAVVPQRED